MHRFELRDDQWERIKNILPGQEGHVGVTARNNRLFLNAVFWIVRTGTPWRDLPKCYGNWKTVYNRFSRWAKNGVWQDIFDKLGEDADMEWLLIDSTIVRAHQHAAGAKGGKKIKH